MSKRNPFQQGRKNNPQGPAIPSGPNVTHKNPFQKARSRGAKGGAMAGGRPHKGGGGAAHPPRSQVDPMKVGRRPARIKSAGRVASGKSRAPPKGSAAAKALMSKLRAMKAQRMATQINRG